MLKFRNKKRNKEDEQYKKQHIEYIEFCNNYNEEFEMKKKLCENTEHEILQDIYRAIFLYSLDNYFPCFTNQAFNWCKNIIGIKNPRETLKIACDEGLLKEKELKERLQLILNIELYEIAKRLGVDASCSGKEELIDKLIKQCGYEKIKGWLSDGMYELTEKGKELLNQYSVYTQIFERFPTEFTMRECLDYVIKNPTKTTSSEIIIGILDQRKKKNIKKYGATAYAMNKEIDMNLYGYYDSKSMREEKLFLEINALYVYINTLILKEGFEKTATRISAEANKRYFSSFKYMIDDIQENKEFYSKKMVYQKNEWVEGYIYTWYYFYELLDKIINENYTYYQAADYLSTQLKVFSLI